MLLTSKLATLGRHPDILIALVGVLLGIVLIPLFIFLGILQPIGLSLVMIITGTSYLFLHRRGRLTALQAIHSLPLSQAVSARLAYVLTFLVTISSLVIMATSADMLHRPWYAFVLAAVLMGVVLLELLVTCRSESVNALIVVQVLVLAAGILTSTLSVYPYNGGDMWAHLANAANVSQNHSISAIQGAYRNYPLYPTVLSVFSTMTGLSNSTIASLFAVGVVVISLLLWLSALQRHYGTFFHAIAYVIILVGSKWFLHWGGLPVSMNIALLFFTFLCVIIIRDFFEDMSTVNKVAMFVITGLLPFFHPIGAMSAVLLFVSFLVIDRFLLKAKTRTSLSLLNLSLFVIVVTLAQWMYYGGFFADSVRKLAEAIFVDDLASYRLGESFRDPIVYNLDNLNFYLLLFVSGMGLLYEVQVKKDRLVLYAGLSGFFFIAFGFATQFINLQTVIPYRWFLFGTLLITLPASALLARVFNSSSVWLKLLAAASISVYLFFGIANTENNRDSPLYGLATTELYELTSSEYHGLSFIQALTTNTPLKVRVDYRLWDFLRYQPNNQRIGSWKAIDLSEFTGVFSLRNVYFQRIWFVGDSARQVDLSEPGIHQVYDSGDMRWLERTGTH